MHIFMDTSLVRKKKSLLYNSLPFTLLSFLDLKKKRRIGGGDIISLMEKKVVTLILLSQKF